MKTSPLLLISILLVGRFTALGVTLPAAEDSYGFRAKLSSVANKATTLPVDATHRAFLYFDLANELPANTTIRYARLRIYLPKVTRAGEGIAVHQVTSTWDESLASSEPAFTTTPFATFPSARMGTKRFISVDVTNVVQSWITAPATNEGFAITAIPGATAKLTASVLLGAKEGAGSGYPAELDIEIATDPVAAGAIGSPQLAAGAVQSTNIASGAVGVSALADGSVTTQKLALGAVTDEKIAGISGTKVSGAVASATAANTAADANTVNGISASTIPTPNTLLPLNSSGKFPVSTLPDLNASNLASGTLPDARLAGVYGSALSFTNSSNSYAGDGSSLTNLNATNLASGVIPSERLAAGTAQIIHVTNPLPAGYAETGLGLANWRVQPASYTGSVFGGPIFSIGGRTFVAGAGRVIEIAINTGEWGSSVTVSHDLALTAYDGNELVYMCGGNNGGAQPTAVSFNPLTGAKTILPNMPGQIIGGSAVYLNGHVYVFGQNAINYDFNVALQQWSSFTAVVLPGEGGPIGAFNASVVGLSIFARTGSGALARITPGDSGWVKVIKLDILGDSVSLIGLSQTRLAIISAHLEVHILDTNSGNYTTSAMLPANSDDERSFGIVNGEIILAGRVPHLHRAPIASFRRVLVRE